MNEDKERSYKWAAASGWGTALLLLAFIVWVCLGGWQIIAMLFFYRQ